MSGYKKRYDEILETEWVDHSKKVLVVEGEDDQAAYRLLFDKKFGTENWDSKWVITYAGQKNFVLKMLAEQPAWIGLVDKDEWSQEEIVANQSTYPNLLVLPRYCMESYLILPAEIWAALPEKQQQKIPNGEEELEKVLLCDLDQWVRHGVLWTVVNPLQNGLRVQGFNNALLNFEIAQDDDAIRQTLSNWHNTLNPDTLFARFQTLLQEAEQMTPEQQLKQWVHGKHFWNKHVSRTLSRMLGQPDRKDALLSLWKTRPLPDDWDEAIWSRITL